MIIADMEAGLEHLSRSTTRASDVMLVVAEPYYKSIETALRIQDMAAEMNIPLVFWIANKIRTDRDRDLIAGFGEKHNLKILAALPYDEQVERAAQIPMAPMDFCPESSAVTQIIGLAQKISALETD